jgi:hypothetical protein
MFVRAYGAQIIRLHFARFAQHSPEAHRRPSPSTSRGFEKNQPFRGE